MKTIRIEGIIGWDYFAQELRRELTAAEGESIRIELSSPGGDVFEGLEMYYMLADYPEHISVRLGALLASAATLIPCAANWVVARPETIALIHRSWTCICGDTDELGAESKLLGDLDEIIAKVYTQRLGRPVDTLLADMAGDTWLMGGDAIVDYGLADEIEPGEELDTGKESEIKKEAKKTIEDIELKLKKLEEVRPAAMFRRRFFATKTTKTKNKEEAKMPNESTLHELLSAHPKAKAEHDALINAAAKAVEDKYAKQVEAAIDNTLDIVAASGLRLDTDMEAAARSQRDAGEYALELIKSSIDTAPKANASQIGAVSRAKPPAETAPPNRNQEEITYWNNLYGREEGKNAENRNPR